MKKKPPEVVFVQAQNKFLISSVIIRVGLELSGGKTRSQVN